MKRFNIRITRYLEQSFKVEASSMKKAKTMVEKMLREAGENNWNFAHCNKEGF